METKRNGTEHATGGGGGVSAEKCDIFLQIRVVILYHTVHGSGIFVAFFDIFFFNMLFSFDVDRAREVMEKAEAKMIEAPMDQKALDRLLQAQATFEAVGGLTQDRLVAQVRTVFIFISYVPFYVFPADSRRHRHRSISLSPDTCLCRCKGAIP